MSRLKRASKKWSFKSKEKCMRYKDKGKESFLKSNIKILNVNKIRKVTLQKTIPQWRKVTWIKDLNFTDYEHILNIKGIIGAIWKKSTYWYIFKSPFGVPTGTRLTSKMPGAFQYSGIDDVGRRRSQMYRYAGNPLCVTAEISW